VAQLPEWLNGMKNPKDRIVQLCNAILDFRFDLDVLCFQELFSDTARTLAQQILSARYPHSVVDNHSGKLLFGVNSGLAVFSRIPIVEHHWMEYDTKRNVDLMSRKGGLCVKLQPTSLSYPVYVTTTHMQAGGDHEACCCCNAFSASAADIKVEQLEQLSKFTAKHVTEPGVSLMCGDFNMTPRENPLTHLRRYFPDARDPFNAHATSYAYTVSDNKRIDYTFVLGAPAHISSRSTIEDLQGFTLTDHRPVVLELRLHG
jgi:endonuclease/exonuclease/phosphatase family metal-dependent hydrolase